MRACHTGMRPHNRGVQHPMLGVGIGGERGEHPLPDARLTPADKPLVHRVPRAVFGRQQAPLRATMAHPFHRLDETAARVFISANVGPRLLAQERGNLGPVGVAQSY
ncbi:MAG TPA: hypothetical protein VHZ51_26090, partial [Ktedonobacteraceae bacterium]|nr:hypothetical protein [Ktedonobacteraceae bacterium]